MEPKLVHRTRKELTSQEVLCHNLQSRADESDHKVVVEGSKLLDLTGKIEDAALRNITRCGGGGFGDVYRLQHAELGDIAMKRVREVGDQIKVSDERRVRSSYQERNCWA